eukprot:SAG25_NODE_44_length_19254_cov_246.998121_31_plen_295_part_00
MDGAPTTSAAVAAPQATQRYGALASGGMPQVIANLQARNSLADADEPHSHTAPAPQKEVKGEADEEGAEEDDDGENEEARALIARLRSARQATAPAGAPAPETPVSRADSQSPAGFEVEDVPPSPELLGSASKELAAIRRGIAAVAADDEYTRRGISVTASVLIMMSLNSIACLTAIHIPCRRRWRGHAHPAQRATGVSAHHGGHAAASDREPIAHPRAGDTPRRRRRCTAHMMMIEAITAPGWDYPTFLLIPPPVLIMLNGAAIGRPRHRCGQQRRHDACESSGGLDPWCGAA